MRFRAVFPAAIAAIALSFATKSASAQDDAPAPQRTAEVRERVPSKEEEPRRAAVTLNPLALVIGRYGGNVEVTIADHHVVAVSGFLQTFSLPTWRPLLPADVRDRLRGNPTMPGGEIGYRLYSGKGGTEGLFVGPSFVLTPLVYPRFAGGRTLETSTVELVGFYAPGVALDVGAQTVTSAGFTFGGGIGAQYLAYTLPDDPQRIPLNVTPHWTPRLLLAAGWSF